MSSEYNGNILYVKDENGEWIPIPSIVGPEGKGVNIIDYKNQYTLEEVSEMKPGSAIFRSVNGVGILYYYKDEDPARIVFESCAHINYDSGVVSFGNIVVSKSNGSVTSGGNPVQLVPNTTYGNPGDVLTINAYGNNIEWSAGGSSLPEYTSSDSGKLLAVNSSGDGVEWSAGGNTKSIVIPYSSLPYTLTAEEQARVEVGTLLIITDSGLWEPNIKKELYICQGIYNNNWYFKKIGSTDGSDLQIDNRWKLVPTDTMIVPWGSTSQDISLVNGNIDYTKGLYYWLPVREVTGPNSRNPATWKSVLDLLANAGNLDTSVDGTYTLQCTITDGVPTYSWV